MKNYFYVSMLLATACCFQLQGMNKENHRILKNVQSFKQEQNYIREFEKAIQEKNISATFSDSIKLMFDVEKAADLDQQIFDNLDQETILKIITKKIKVVGYLAVYKQCEKELKSK